MRMGVLSSGDVINIGADPLETIPVQWDSLPAPGSGNTPILPDIQVVGDCYPSSFMGPIPSDGVYCETGTGVAAGAGTGTGSTGTILKGVPNSAVYAMLGIIGVFVFLGAKK